MASNRRLNIEIQNMMKDNNLERNHYCIELVGETNSHLFGKIVGPPDTPFQRGVFTIDITIPDRYPLAPPACKFVTRVWHPNISSMTGAIGLDILHTQLVLKRPPVSRQDFRQQLSAGLPDIILTPWIASEIIPYLDGMRKYHLNYQATTVVDYLDENVIVARTRLGTPFTMFSYFTCFAPNVWLAVFVSLVVLAVVLSVGCGNTTPKGRHRDTCPKRLYESAWNLSNILYQKSLQNFLQKLRHRLSPALVIGVWLVSALVLSIEFTSFLLDYMHRSVPTLAVDSLRELTEWDDMRLYVSNVSSLYSYVMKESATDPLARAINDRMILYSTTGWLSIKFALQMLRRLMSGSYAMTTNRLTAIFILFHLVEIDNRVGGPALQDVLHVSRYGSEFAPFFMAFNSDCQQFITNGFNQIV
ncbi:unnamed protein product [Medioppia subpectinata]|uniref:UBC core domain-containing protein n=1 Tax=Medioppia subpectinata TaxID=1979941 RepID=A0A7R9L7A9_9ACAR|nr:unnamed protein product [Medioppia subpectinata]CAG2116497.1 unnamed protein product [Medioppia subpectinata]